MTRISSKLLLGGAVTVNPSGRILLLLATVLAGRLPLSAEVFTTNRVEALYTNAAGQVVVGNTGPSNALIIINQGRLEDTTGILGNSALAGNNLALVSGVNSLWDNTSALLVGNFGSANQLIVTNGGRVNGGLSVLGQNLASTSNVARVAGSGSLWTCPGGLHIGEGGDGNQVQIVEGGRVYSGGYASVGYTVPSSGNRLFLCGPGSAMIHDGTFSVGSFGSVSNHGIVCGGAFLYSGLGALGNGGGNTLQVNDPGTWWQVDSLLFLGREGAFNELTISNGGRVSCNSAVMSGHSNRVTVVGANSIWDTGYTQAQCVVGDTGFSNHLALVDGGRVNSWASFITGNSNVASVTGSGALLNNSDLLAVGEEFGRANQLSITAGGEVRTGDAILGGDHGQLTVGGAAASLLVSNALGVGGEVGYNNRLIISGGARVSSAAGYIGGLASPYDPHGRNGFNLALVSGTGSQWTNQADLVVGSTGSGNALAISDGAEVHNRFGFIGYHGAGFNGSVSVAGTNALWRNRQDLFVGYESSGNQLVIDRGGQVASANGWVGRRYNRNNRVLVDGPGSSWQIQGGLVVGNSGYNSRLTVSSGGLVQCASGYLDAPNDPNPGTSNAVVVTGTDARWLVAGPVVVGVSSSVNELRIEDGGVLIAGDLTVGSANTLNNVLTIESGTLIITNASGAGTLDLRRASAAVNGGAVTVDRLLGGAQSALTLGAGEVTVRRGTILASSQPLFVGGTAGPAQLRLLSGSHVIAGGLAVAPNSALSAAGRLSGTVSNAGTLLIGAPIGSLALDDDLHLADSAVFAFDLGGPQRGTQHDFVRVSNAVTFGGTLRIALVNGYVPASNAVLTLMESGLAAGVFLNAPAGARIVLEGSPVTAEVDYSEGALRLLNFENAAPATNEIDSGWAIHYFGHAPLTEAEKAADPDGDGLSNLEEYLAGTDPLVPESVLKILPIARRPSGEVVLQFKCVEGRTYSIAYSADLASWQEVLSPALSQPGPGVCEWIDDGSQTGGVPASGNRFYRVAVR